MENTEINTNENLTGEITETKENERNAQEQKTIIPIAQPEQAEELLTLEDFGGDINKLYDTYIKKGNVELPPWLEETKKGIEVIPQELFLYIEATEHIKFCKNGNSENTILYKYNNQKGVYELWKEGTRKAYIKSFIPTKIRKSYQWEMIDKELRTEEADTDESEFNSNENIINCKNGILDLRTRKLSPHSPQYLTTIQIPCNYKPNVTLQDAPITLEFLETLTDKNYADITTHLEIVGVVNSNVKAWRFKKMIIIFGKGNTRQECMERSFNTDGWNRKYFYERYTTN